MASPLGANRKQTPLMTVTTSQGRKGGRIDIWLGKEKTPKPEKAAEGTEEWAKVTISDPPPSSSVRLQKESACSEFMPGKKEKRKGETGRQRVRVGASKFEYTP